MRRLPKNCMAEIHACTRVINDCAVMLGLSYNRAQDYVAERTAEWQDTGECDHYEDWAEKLDKAFDALVLASEALKDLRPSWDEKDSD